MSSTARQASIRRARGYWPISGTTCWHLASGERGLADYQLRKALAAGGFVEEWAPLLAAAIAHAAVA
jgi:hypothetical protein